MQATHPGEDCGADKKTWCVFFFSVAGDLRFISHLDTLRLFRRALARARIPVRFSQGFNPHSRISIPLPRPVGLASDAEALVVELQHPIDEADALEQLAGQMPSGITLTSARRLEGSKRLVPDLVKYRFPCGAQPPTDLPLNMERVLGSSELKVNRGNHKNGRRRSIDLRPFLVDVRTVGGDVEMTLRVTEKGTAKPVEIAELLGYDADTINHQVRRIEVQWC